MLVEERAEREYLNFKVDDYDFRYETPFDRIQDLDFPFIFIIDGPVFKIRAEKANKFSSNTETDIVRFSDALEDIDNYIKKQLND